MRPLRHHGRLPLNVFLPARCPHHLNVGVLCAEASYAWRPPAPAGPASPRMPSPRGRHGRPGPESSGGGALSSAERPAGDVSPGPARVGAETLPSPVEVGTPRFLREPATRPSRVVSPGWTKATIEGSLFFFFAVNRESLARVTLLFLRGLELLRLLTSRKHTT